MPGNPPNLDVVIEPETGPVIGIESKFTEWMTRKPPGKTPFKGKYFPSGEGVWARQGLGRSQSLADRFQAAEVFFRYLDAAQLLKHALGLASHLGDRFRLFYVYFDVAGPAGDAHRQEIGQFAGFVGEELGFGALSYQELFRRMVALGAGSADYLGYLEDRYFREANE